MQNAKLMLTCLAFAGLAALAGCSFPGVYKIDIQQGNVVTQDMIDQLRPGMTRRQVRFIMGNPLIVDTFHANRWDYLYSIQPGGGRRQQERVSLFFNDSDQLAGLNGDFMPGVSRDEAILGKEGSTTVTQPADQQKPEAQKEEPPKPGSTLEQLQREVDEAQPVPVPTPEPLDPARNDGWRSTKKPGIRRAFSFPQETPRLTAFAFAPGPCGTLLAAPPWDRRSAGGRSPPVRRPPALRSSGRARSLPKIPSGQRLHIQSLERPRRCQESQHGSRALVPAGTLRRSNACRSGSA
ncbi:outer membrane lipoprotein OmlA [Pseudomonas aeruginosa]|nr:outer membrane lipoprotein OmlA [Pseudomonas aeruginosa]